MWSVVRWYTAMRRLLKRSKSKSVLPPRSVTNAIMRLSETTTDGDPRMSLAAGPSHS
jgi:hypothetical protein